MQSKEVVFRAGVFTVKISDRKLDGNFFCANPSLSHSLWFYLWKSRVIRPHNCSSNNSEFKSNFNSPLLNYEIIGCRPCCSSCSSFRPWQTSCLPREPCFHLWWTTNMRQELQKPILLLPSPRGRSSLLSKFERWANLLPGQYRVSDSRILLKTGRILQGPS